MNSHKTNSITGILQRSSLRIFFEALAAFLFLISARSNLSAFGILAEWQASPINGNWNNNANWSPAAPNGPSDTAIFETSSITNIAITANTQVASITFASGASAFSITGSPNLALTISGNGISNSSGITQNFVTAIDNSGNEGKIQFENSATAGSMTIFTNNGSAFSGRFGGLVEFFNTSSAGTAAITNEGGTVSSGSGGFTLFADNSTAGSATISNDGGTASGAGGAETDFNNASTAGSASIINNGAMISTANGATTLFRDTSNAGSAAITNNAEGVSGAAGRAVGETVFQDSSTAGSAIIVNNGAKVSGAVGGTVIFDDSSTAGSAKLIANGGTGGGAGGAIFFSTASASSTARVEVFGSGELDISSPKAPSVTVGSVQGNGKIFLGALNLTVGSNNQSTTFSGIIQDGGVLGGTGGSVSKIGTGNLSLTKASTYTGTTTVNKGALLVKNTTGSATGAGAVQVNGGTLGGTGKIAAAVTVGNGTSSGAVLLGGNSGTSPGLLTINDSLTFRSLATYKCVLNRSILKASTVVALGVTINSNVPFTFVDNGTATLPVGTVFTVINNTSANPIFGRFSNLAGGSTFTSNGNTFKVNYTGGTGNDLTLKVLQ
jgi:autotransporter-associated beta strand protein